MSGWLSHALEDEAVLLCFHFAGGGASAYAGWRKRGMSGASVCAVQLPGREGRARDARLTDYGLLVRHLKEELLPHLIGRRIVIYGHSLGAWIAWDVALMLAELGAPPVGLIVGAQRAPSRRYPYPANHLLADAELTAHLQGHGLLLDPAIDREMLRCWVLPLVRDDLALCEGRAVSHERACFPVMAIAGRHDRLVDEDDVRAWSDHSDDGFSYVTVDAGHMFVLTHSAELHGLVDAALRAWL